MRIFRSLFNLTRSSERTRIAYSPVTLILKEILMVWEGRRGKGIIKNRYLMLIFKIVLLELSEVETHRQKTDRRKIAQTDGHNILNIGIWCDTFKTKKEFLKSDC